MRNIFSIGKSNAKVYTKHDKVNTKFDDVAGLPEAKTEIRVGKVAKKKSLKFLGICRLLKESKEIRRFGS